MTGTGLPHYCAVLHHAAATGSHVYINLVYNAEAHALNNRANCKMLFFLLLYTKF